MRFGPKQILLTAAAALAMTGMVAGPAQAANPTLHISKVYFDSPGSDTGSNTSLNAEYVRIKNSSTTKSYTLTGFTLRDKANHVYTFKTFTLKPGTSVTVHTGKGTNTSSHVYWNKNWYVWNNTGDTATLKNASGTTVDSCTFTSAGDYKVC